MKKILIIAILLLGFISSIYSIQIVKNVQNENLAQVGDSVIATNEQMKIAREIARGISVTFFREFSQKEADFFVNRFPTPTPPQSPTPAPTSTPGVVYLSNLAWSSVVNGFGPVEKDRSNGDVAAGDGKVITLQGVKYTKGLGVHANSNIKYSLGGKYTSFKAFVGIDDEVNNNGSVIFQVFVDGVRLFDSGLMMGSSTTKSVNINVTGKKEIRLTVLSNGANTADHADWADAKLISVTN